MKLSGFLPLTVFLALCSCGDGGVSLDTDNVKGEYYPKGSRTAIMLEDELITRTSDEQTTAYGIKLDYVSYGNNQGSLSIDGRPQEQASLTNEAAQTITFTTPTSQIRLDVTPTGAHSAAITEWSYITDRTNTPRLGTKGVSQTQVDK